jgi:hypothetical protein
MSDWKRFHIASLAMAQAVAGGHYLKGARGGIPGGPSVLGRSVSLKQEPSWSKLRVHTGMNSLQTCYGRWAALSGYLFKPGSSELKELKDYVGIWEKKPMSSWPHFDKPGLFPRRLGGSDSSIALGEDCRNKRHFDCIGFIYWVLHEVVPTGKWMNFGINSYSKSGTYWSHLGMVSAADVKHGDIVTRPAGSPAHIGFVSLGNKVVHASIESKGVIVETYTPGDWGGGVARIKDAHL